MLFWLHFFLLFLKLQNQGSFFLMRGSHLPPNFGQSARLVLEHFKPKLHDLFRSFARRQLPGPTDAKVGSGTTRLERADDLEADTGAVGICRLSMTEFS